MTYETLYKDFKRAIPECIEFVSNKETEFDLDDTDGMHVLFGTAIEPYVDMALHEGNIETVKNIADFMEQMEEAPDIHISEVLEQSIIEGIISRDREIIAAYENIWGEKTKESFKAISRFYA